MNIKINTTRKYISNSKEIKVNLTFNKISQETAEKFVAEVENWYNTTITKSNQKVG